MKDLAIILTVVGDKRRFQDFVVVFAGMFRPDNMYIVIFEHEAKEYDIV
jgi:hypothetical protein